MPHACKCPQTSEEDIGYPAMGGYEPHYRSWKLNLNFYSPKVGAFY